MCFPKMIEDLEIGTFMMTTCFIANYQSVQVCQNNQFPYFSEGNMYASASSFDALFPPCAKLPFHGVELQPSPVCPKNFVIFDQTYDRSSQVMYHPELTPRLVNSGLASTFQTEYVGGGEDPNEIDALLSTDEEDENEDGGDSEEVSGTARNSSREYASAGSCCSRRNQSLSGNSSSCNNDGKGRRKKMMGVLRRIVPGGEEMNTASVLDEAVPQVT